MRQTVVVMTALVIALLGVSGFIVAGSVGQVERLAETDALAETLAGRLREEAARADALEKENQKLKTACSTAVRERDLAILDRKAQAARADELNVESLKRTGERDALLLSAQALTDERDALLKECETLYQECGALNLRLEQAQQATRQATAYAAELETERSALMEEAALAAMRYEQRAQEDAQVIEMLFAQAETLEQAVRRLEDAQAEQQTAPAKTQGPQQNVELTPVPVPTIKPLFALPVPQTP